MIRLYIILLFFLSSCGYPDIDTVPNFDNVNIVKKAGVDILVSGSTIFKSNNGNIKKNIEKLKNR